MSKLLLDGERCVLLRLVLTLRSLKQSCRFREASNLYCVQCMRAVRATRRRPVVDKVRRCWAWQFVARKHVMGKRVGGGIRLKSHKFSISLALTNMRALTD